MKKFTGFYNGIKQELNSYDDEIKMNLLMKEQLQASMKVLEYIINFCNANSLKITAIDHKYSNETVISMKYTKLALKTIRKYIFELFKSYSFKRGAIISRILINGIIIIIIRYDKINLPLVKSK